MSRVARSFAESVGRVDDILNNAGTALYPVIDLLVRFWLAQQFWVSGILKAANWDNALYLAANEYPVSWLAPKTAALLGVSIELVGPIFLLLGLATRFAAVPMLALSLVIEFAYVSLPINLLCAGTLGWYVVHGAGPISLDRPLKRGFAGSAFPFAKQLGAGLLALTARLGPLYILFIRMWISVSVVTVAAVTGASPQVTLFLTFCAILILLGLTTRLAVLPLAAFCATDLLWGGAEQDQLYRAALLLLVACVGAGPLSLDAPLGQAVRRLTRQFENVWLDSAADLPRVVIVGAGFGGIAAARALRRTACRVTLIDRHNYHLFQPLLYQVATAGLSPADIATPIRGMFRDQSNVRVQFGEVTGVDCAVRRVMMDGAEIPYDYLILATGARHSYFGHDDWAPFAPGLKRIEDATAIRHRLLLAFELAESSSSEEERRALLTLVIVGGGPTGVEMAGAIAELARKGMEREFRTIDPASARILLVESSPRILAQFPEALSATAAQSLRDLGVEVIAGVAVQAIDSDGVVIGGERVPAKTVLWAAGVTASPAAKWLGCEADRAGRVKVAADLSVPGRGEIFVIGDTALSDAWNGKSVPGLAPAAKQGGHYVAGVIRAHIEGGRAPVPFRYRHLGSLATIGRKSAVADFGRIRLRGAIAWWLWGGIHVAFLVGGRNRASVVLEWFWAYLTFRRGTRLITGEKP